MGQGQPGYRNVQEDKYDFYCTPYCLTRELCNLNLFDKQSQIYDPAAGDGAIITELEYQGFTNLKQDDIRTTKKDFLKCANKVDHIIMNPPFNQFDAFVRKAKEVSEGIFATIIKTNFFGAVKRHKSGLWNGLRDLYIFNRQINYGERPDIVTAGMIISGWAIFDPDWKESWWKTSIIDIQKYF